LTSASLAVNAKEAISDLTASKEEEIYSSRIKPQTTNVMLKLSLHHCFMWEVGPGISFVIMTLDVMV
jgi:hypothetical protein